MTPYKEKTAVDRGIFIPLSRPQDFEESAVHGWYNFVLGFSDKLVAEMMDRLGVEKGQLVFDPFCGTGTTLVETMKRGIASVGIDASPFSCFVSRIKTNRLLSANKLLGTFADLRIEYERAQGNFRSTGTYKYLSESGMLDRGWISDVPLRDALALKSSILRVAPDAATRDALLIALIGNLSTGIANMRYGPEIYCGRKKKNVDVWGIFQANILKILQDLGEIEGEKLGRARIFQGDARNCASVLRKNGIRKVHVAISSPPYPTEHDYTRNTRLELAFLDFVTGNDSVRSIKQSMIRSHTKGVYKTDQDSSLVVGYKQISNLTNQIDELCKAKTHGFARLYSTVVRSYFGGMKKHFQSMASVLAKGGQYAVVVGDQASYLGVHIPTSKILGVIAQDCGFDVQDSIVWRQRWATKSSKLIKEHALILKRVGA
jgi:DNA modification methylase